MFFGTEAFEIGILYSIQDILRCRFVDYFMKFISFIGNGGALWIGVALVLIISKKYRKTGVMMGVGLVLGLIFGNIILKNLIARPRPCWLESDYPLLIANPTDFSFPSGHTLASFISAFVMLGDSKKLGIPALIMAVIMAFSRMYLFVHFPTDILGGTVLAALIYVVMRIVLRIIKNKKRMLH